MATANIAGRCWGKWTRAGSENLWMWPLFQNTSHTESSELHLPSNNRLKGADMTDKRNIDKQWEALLKGNGWGALHMNKLVCLIC